MAHRGADAVGAGVAAADDDHVLALARGWAHVRRRCRAGLGVRGEELHREVDALEVAALDRQDRAAASRRCRGRSRRTPAAASAARRSSPTLALQTKLMPSSSMSSTRRWTTSRLSSFMFGMPYMSRPPTVGALEDGDRVAGLVELRGGGEAGGAGADDRDLLAGATCGGSRHDPAFLEALVDDRSFDVLDRDRRLVDAEHARAFARRGADAAGELGEVVRLVQAVERLLPQAAVDEVVPLRDEVVDRAARWPCR